MSPLERTVTVETASFYLDPAIELYVLALRVGFGNLSIPVKLTREQTREAMKIWGITYATHAAGCSCVVKYTPAASPVAVTFVRAIGRSGQ